MPSHLSFLTAALCCLLMLVSTTFAFQASTTTTPAGPTPPLFMSTDTPPKSNTKSGYVPKWKKKKTLADEVGDIGSFEDKGIKGTISVVFLQGEDRKETMAMPGQPLRDVATQAGQFIKYGCGKGECGTCEALCNGQWIRPCQATVPAATQDELVIQVKEVSNKSKSSGKFFSVKSFFMGFWNNLLGMVGFVKYRQNAKQNWEERQEYENLIKELTLQKRHKRQKAFLEQKRNKLEAAKGERKEFGKLSP